MNFKIITGVEEYINVSNTLKQKKNALISNPQRYKTLQRICQTEQQKGEANEKDSQNQ